MVTKLILVTTANFNFAHNFEIVENDDNHLMVFLKKHDNQSGFRAKQSCQTALVNLIDAWMKCIDNEGMVRVLFIDF